jgi:hypothetical protein
MNEVAVLFLAFIATYCVFMYFAYRLAKIFFPTVDEKDSVRSVSSSKETDKKTMVNRMAIKKA